MAAAVFSSLGQALGGPFGAFAGAMAGSAIDAVVFGGRDRGAVEQIQRSAYGVPIPKLFGRARVAGVLIWAHVTDQGAKGSGERAGAASIAVALSSRPILGVGRVWADGREIRNAAGEFETPTVMRVHRGDNRAADPMIEASEGLDGAPAYQGLAYVVFENLSLEPFGNRIPNLSFEVEADDASIGAWIGEMGGWAGAASREAGEWAVLGYVAAGGGAGADVGPMMRLAGAHVCHRDGAFGIAADGVAHTVPLADVLVGDVERVCAVSGRPAGVSIGYMDPERDYQAGLQQAVRGRGGGRQEAVTVSAVMPAADARRAAQGWLRDAAMEAETIRLALGWKWMGIAVGDDIRLDGGDVRWRVTQRTVRGLAVHLVAARQADRPVVAAVADAGRAMVAPARVAPPSTLHVFETLAEDGAPMLMVSANGGAGWKGCAVRLLKSWEQVEVGRVRARRPAGVLVEPLGAGGPFLWDRESVVVVELADADLGLESRREAEVLAGANLLRVGDELLRFCSAEALGARRYALRGLLRNCMAGGEPAGEHAPGVEVELVGDLLEVPVSADMIGATLTFIAEGPGDPPGGTAVEIVVRGAG